MKIITIVLFLLYTSFATASFSSSEVAEFEECVKKFQPDIRLSIRSFPEKDYHWYQRFFAYLSSLGFDFNTKYSRNDTLILAAISECFPDMVQALLELGVEINLELVPQINTNHHDCERVHNILLEFAGSKQSACPKRSFDRLESSNSAADGADQGNLKKAATEISVSPEIFDQFPKSGSFDGYLIDDNLPISDEFLDVFLNLDQIQPPQSTQLPQPPQSTHLPQPPQKDIYHRPLLVADIPMRYDNVPNYDAGTLYTPF